MDIFSVIKQINLLAFLCVITPNTAIKVTTILAGSNDYRAYYTKLRTNKRYSRW